MQQVEDIWHNFLFFPSLHTCFKFLFCTPVVLLPMNNKADLRFECLTVSTTPPPPPRSGKHFHTSVFLLLPLSEQLLFYLFQEAHSSSSRCTKASVLSCSIHCLKSQMWAITASYLNGSQMPEPPMQILSQLIFACSSSRIRNVNRNRLRAPGYRSLKQFEMRNFSYFSRGLEITIAFLSYAEDVVFVFKVFNVPLSFVSSTLW